MSIRMLGKKKLTLANTSLFKLSYIIDVRLKNPVSVRLYASQHQDEQRKRLDVLNW